MKWFLSLTMRKRLGVIGMLLVLGACSFLMTFGFPPYSRLFPGFERYVNQSADFAVSYPNDWLLLETPGGSRGEPAMVVNMTYFKFMFPAIQMSVSRSNTTYESLIRVTEWGKQLSGKRMSYQEISTTSQNIKGEDTILHEYTFELGKSPVVDDSTMRCLDNYRFHNGNGYIISLCVIRADFPQTRPTFEKIFDGFSYLN